MERNHLEINNDIMKKFIAILCVFFTLTSVSAKTYRGFMEASWGIHNYYANNYECMITANYTDDRDKLFGMTSVSLYTTHGVQITRMFFVGGGLNTTLGFGHNNNRFENIGIYGDIRWDGFGLPRISQTVTPFADLKIGCSIKTFDYKPITVVESYIDNDGKNSFYENYRYYNYKFLKHQRVPDTGLLLRPSLGMRIRLNERTGLNISIAYTLRNAKEYKIESVEEIPIENSNSIENYLYYSSKNQIFGARTLEFGIGVDF